MSCEEGGLAGHDFPWLSAMDLPEVKSIEIVKSPMDEDG
jgi:hypothetical protein